MNAYEEGITKQLAGAMLASEGATVSRDRAVAIAREAASLVNLHQQIAVLIHAARKGAVIDLDVEDGSLFTFPHPRSRSYTAAMHEAITQVLREYELMSAERFEELEAEVFSDLDPETRDAFDEGLDER